MRGYSEDDIFLPLEGGGNFSFTYTRGKKVLKPASFLSLLQEKEGDLTPSEGWR